MYNHAYTDGHGNYFLRDYDDGTLPFENATEWRKLKIIIRFISIPLERIIYARHLPIPPLLEFTGFTHFI
jgi:hypothetical protein